MSIERFCQALRAMGLRLLPEQKLHTVADTDIHIGYNKNVGSNDRLVRCYFTPLDRIDGATSLIAHLASCRTKAKELEVLKIFTGNKNIKSKRLE